MTNTIILRLLDTHNDQASNLPDQFMPGAGAGHVYFQVELVGQGYPTHRLLSHALVKWQQDSMLMEYDEITGAGRFVIVDGVAPGLDQFWSCKT